MPLEFLPVFPINAIMSIYWIHVCTRGGQFVYNLSYWKSCLIVLIGSFIFPILLAFLIIDIVYALWNRKYSRNLSLWRKLTDFSQKLQIQGNC
jgi:RsiW-degrading membrane proteinase PrsW (M82 family)